MTRANAHKFEDWAKKMFLELTIELEYRCGVSHPSKPLPEQVREAAIEALRLQKAEASATVLTPNPGLRDHLPLGSDTIVRS